MGYLLASARCHGCRRYITFNVERVPSVPINPQTGQVEEGGIRRPLCRDCVKRVNELRRREGRPEIEIYPDSYGPQEVE